MRVWESFVRLSLVASLALSAAAPRLCAADFVPEEVFAGRSLGNGTLKLIFQKPRPFVVEGRGAAGADGTFVLDQKVQFPSKPVESRSWVMRRTGAATWSATLTDAAGPVAARISGARMTLRYPIRRWGLVMHQTLDLAADGESVRNRGRITFLGIPFGELEETILLHR